MPLIWQENENQKTKTDHIKYQHNSSLSGCCSRSNEKILQQRTWHHISGNEKTPQKRKRQKAPPALLQGHVCPSKAQDKNMTWTVITWQNSRKQLNTCPSRSAERSRRFIKGLCPSRRDETIIHQRTKYYKSPYFNTRHEPLMKLRASPHYITEQDITAQNRTAHDNTKRGFGPAKGWIVPSNTAPKNIHQQTTRQKKTSAFRRADGSKHYRTAQHTTKQNTTEQHKLPAWPGEGMKPFSYNANHIWTSERMKRD